MVDAILSRSSSVYIHFNSVHIIALSLGCLFQDVLPGAEGGDRRLLGKKVRGGEADVEGIRRQTGFPGEHEQTSQRRCLIVGRGVTTQRGISRKRKMGKRTEVENKERN